MGTGLLPVSRMNTASVAFSSLHMIRGGASTSALIDFSRESLSLTGIGTYATIAALVMNSSLRLWTSTKFSTEQKEVVSNIFYAASVLCVMSGVFTAILFQLLTIYGRTALGIGNDGGYIAFSRPRWRSGSGDFVHSLLTCLRLS